MKINLKELFNAHNSIGLFVAAVMNVKVSNSTDAVYASTPNDSDTSLTVVGLSAGQGIMIVEGDIMFADRGKKMSTGVVHGSIGVSVTVGTDLEVSLGDPQIPVPVAPIPVVEPVITPVDVEPVSAPVIEPAIPPVEPVVEPVHEPVVGS